MRCRPGSGDVVAVAGGADGRHVADVLDHRGEHASSMMVMMAVMARPAIELRTEDGRTPSFQVNGMPIHRLSNAREVHDAAAELLLTIRPHHHAQQDGG